MRWDPSQSTLKYRTTAFAQVKRPPAFEKSESFTPVSLACLRRPAHRFSLPSLLGAHMDPREGVFCVHVAILQCHRSVFTATVAETDRVGVLFQGLAFHLVSLPVPEARFPILL